MKDRNPSTLWVITTYLIAITIISGMSWLVIDIFI